MVFGLVLLLIFSLFEEFDLEHWHRTGVGSACRSEIILLVLDVHAVHLPGCPSSFTMPSTLSQAP